MNILNFGVFILLKLVNCELFSSTAEVEKLLHTQEHVLHTLKHYIAEEEKRLDILKRYLKIFYEEIMKVKENPENYIGNPINAFTLIKRLTIDFDYIKSVASHATEYMSDESLVYPTIEDLSGAAMGISRLQTFYKLKTTHLAEGKVEDVVSSPMTKSECYYLALMLYKEQDYHYAAQWFKASILKIKSEVKDPCPLVVTGINGFTLSHNGVKFWELLIIMKLYKDSIAHIDSKLKRALINRGNDVKGLKFYRIAKGTMLNRTSTEISKLKRRIADFTGLNLDHAEKIHVLNYGIGGQYKLHFDAAGDYSRSLGSAGDRIATVLVYLTDVNKGGATVFPELDLAVKPQIGAALYWENLLPSGELDERLRHAACPVLYGNKWISTIWIHQAGQELIRPCPVSRN